MLKSATKKQKGPINDLKMAKMVKYFDHQNKVNGVKNDRSLI